MQIKGILLDVDNTLYDYDEAHSRAFSCVIDYFCDTLGLERGLMEEKYKVARNLIHMELSNTASMHNRLLYFQRMFENIGRGDLSYPLKAYNIYWDTFLENMNMDEGVYEFLTDVAKDRRICFVTDLTAHIQYRKLLKLKLNEFSECLVTSEEAGVEKPHPYIFMLALKKLGFMANEVIMIGDNYKKDIMGALNLGIKSFWLNKNGSRREYGDMVMEFDKFRDLAWYVKEVVLHK